MNLSQALKFIRENMGYSFDDLLKSYREMKGTGIDDVIKEHYKAVEMSSSISVNDILIMMKFLGIDEKLNKYLNKLIIGSINEILSNYCDNKVNLEEHFCKDRAIHFNRLMDKKLEDSIKYIKSSGITPIEYEKLFQEDKT